MCEGGGARKCRFAVSMRCVVSRGESALPPVLRFLVRTCFRFASMCKTVIVLSVKGR